MRARDKPSTNAPAAAAPLTPREQEVLGLLAQGYSPAEIAEQLVLAVSSVRWHIQHVYSKLGVNTKRQAVNRWRVLLAERAPTSAVAASLPHHNLTRALTRFFGREVEIAHVKQQLAQSPLVSLTGPGGVGKTRLSLAIAEAVLDRFPDGLCVVELAALADPALVVQQVAARLDLREDGAKPLADALTDYLRPRQMLLLLDNCEHLLAACAGLADTLLRHCPRLRLLTTSREALGVAGEVVFRVPSLSFPDPGRLPALAQLKDYLAVQLFVDRARLVVPNYELTSRNAAAIARICHRLDGIPLALELAAARLQLLTAEQVAGRLDHAFSLLTNGLRTALPKHQTLRATVDWSFNLLAETEQLLLQRLAVFAGGCTLEAAEAVCSGEGLPVGQVLGGLASLVAKSIVMAGSLDTPAARYHLLEMVRQYGWERLAESGERDVVQTRHRDYFMAQAEAKFSAPAPDDAYWIQKLLPEQENLRAALEWSFQDPPAAGPLDAGPRLVFGAHFFAPLSWKEKCDWCLRALAWCDRNPGVSPLVYAKLAGITGRALSGEDWQAGVALGERAVELARDLGPAGLETFMWNLFHVGSVYAGLSDVERADAHYAEAEAALNVLGSAAFQPGEYELTRGILDQQRAISANQQGRHADAIRLANDALQMFAASGAAWGEYQPRLELGYACLSLGDYASAREHFLHALRYSENEALLLADVKQSGSRQHDDVNQSLAYVKRCLGLADLRLGNLERALDYCRASLRQAELIPAHHLVADALRLAAAICAAGGQPLRAAQLLGAADRLHALRQPPAWENFALDSLLPGWRASPDQAAIAQAFEAGQGLTTAEAAAFGLSAAEE